MRIVIFVDSRYRDTFGAVFVKRELMKLKPSWDVLLVSYDLWRETLELFNPHVVLLNHAIGKRNKMIISAVDQSIVMPTEGRPNTIGQLDWYVDGQDGKMDLFLSWNKVVGDRFSKSPVVVTGCPRFDIYHDLSYLIDSKEKARAKFGLPQNKSVTGVFTSFPQAKFSFMNVEFNLRDWKDLGVTDIETRTDPLEFARAEYQHRLGFMTIVQSNRLLDKDTVYLVKPHPMEDILETQEWADKFGMHVVTQATIHNVLAACDTIVNRRGCMTSLDAWLSGIKESDIVSLGTKEADGLGYEGETLTLDKFAQLCGVDKGGSARRVAEAVVEHMALPSSTTTNREYSRTNRLRLEEIMTTHSARNSLPDPLSGAVGKSAIAGYIKGIEAMPWEN